MRGAGSQWTVALAVGLAVALVLVACGGAATQPPSTAASPSAAGSGLPTPKPTFWPTGVVEATIALGAADGDFTKMANDVVGAVDSNDAVKVLQVMSDALTFLKGNQKNVPRLQDYPATKVVGDELAAAYAQMIEGAQAVIDGMNAGDTEAVQAGFVTFFAGNKAYVAISPRLGDLADQAIFMKRQLLR
ncbi:MAG: hypothetical protein EPO00_06595 [Chloroflexota bacterium]|nr:MAG: hypothetical protein EPO00_06595 [Chloroflexota bacterium]